MHISVAYHILSALCTYFLTEKKRLKPSSKILAFLIG